MNCPIDFTLLYDEHKGYAVRCKTKEDAAELVKWAKTLYPELCTEWEMNQSRYSTHHQNTIYTFDSPAGVRWERTRLMFGHMKTAIGMGYTVIEFEDIYNRPDIEESDKSLDFLFGGIV